MVASCPSLRCSCRKRLCYAEKQRVWICYNTVIVLSVVPCDCCKPTSTCWDWAFSNSELDVCLPAFQLLLEAGRPAFQLRMFAKCDTLPNEIWGTCLFQKSIPAILSWNSKHPLPTRTRSLSFRRAEISISPALWLHHAHAFLAAAEKICHMPRSRGSGGVMVSKICYNTVIVLSVVLCDCCKPTNNCRDWVFSNSELDVCLPALQLPMFAKCDALPKGDVLDMFVQGIHAFCKI